jgi:hypothetical protein
MTDPIMRMAKSFEDVGVRLRRLESADSFKPLVVNVQSKGAVGDGVADDTAAIQASIDIVAAQTTTQGGVVYFPRGVYRVATGLVLPDLNYHSMSFVGEGRRTTRLYADSDTTILTLGVDDGNYNDYVAGTYGVGAYGVSLRIENLSFQGRWVAGGADTSRGIVDWGGGNISLQNVQFSALDYCFWGINSDINSWYDVDALYSNYGIVLERRSDQNQFNVCHFSTCKHALVFRNNTNCHVRNCTFVFNGDPYPDIDVSRDSTALGGDYAATGHHTFSDNWHEIWWAAGPKDSFIDIGITGDGIVGECRIIRPYFLWDNPFVMLWRVRVGQTTGLFIDSPLFTQANFILIPLLWVSDESATPMSQHIVIQAAWSRYGPAEDWVTLEAGSLANVFVVLPEYGTYEAQDDKYAITSSSPPRLVLRLLGDAVAQVDLGTRRLIYGAAAPILGAGTWAIGDIVLNTAPTAGGTIGWVCTAAGDPGTWKTWGAITA